MAKYRIWDKKEDIYTPSGNKYTAEEWKSMYTWIESPNAVMVISDDIINGSFCGELHQLKGIYEQSGAKFSEDLSDEELLTEIEAYETELSREVLPSTEERIAAALEAQVMMNLSNIDIVTLNHDKESPAFKRIERCYQAGLWSMQLIQEAVLKGLITESEKDKILKV